MPELQQLNTSSVQVNDRSIAGVRQRSRQLLSEVISTNPQQEPGLMMRSNSFTTTTSRSRTAILPRLNPAQQLLAEYVADYVVIAVAILVLGLTESASPRRAYLPKAYLPATAFPLYGNSVPAWAVPVYTILVPGAVCAAYVVLWQRPRAVLHHLLLGLLACVMITGAVTNCIKCPVGRLRPDFNARCWPDGKTLWDQEDEQGGWPRCTGNPDVVAEGRKSFPSGHSSWSAAGLGYLTLFLWDVLTPMDGSGHAWRLIIAAAPAVGALAVGISRYTDYWHHWSDILAGLLLGFAMAWLAYQQQKAKVARLEVPQGGANGSQAQLGMEDVEGQQSTLLRGIPPASDGY